MILINKRTTGVAFCFISAFLFSVRYITAAISISGLTIFSSDIFNEALKVSGQPLLAFSVISLAVGITYMVLGETDTKE